MWEKIITYIKQNREQLDVESVPPELWSRIETQLPGASSRNFFSQYPYLKAAAIVFVSVAVSYGVFHYKHMANIKQAAVDLPHTAGAERPIWEPEVEEMESYYEMEVGKKLDQLKIYNLDSYPFAYQFLEELNYAESSYLDLKKDMIQDGYQEVIIQGMIATYEQKIKILEQLIHHINESNIKTQTVKKGENKL